MRPPCCSRCRVPTRLGRCSITASRSNASQTSLLAPTRYRKPRNGLVRQVHVHLAIEHAACESLLQLPHQSFGLQNALPISASQQPVRSSLESAFVQFFAIHLPRPFWQCMAVHGNSHSLPCHYCAFAWRTEFLSLTRYRTTPCAGTVTLIMLPWRPFLPVHKSVVE